MAWWITFNDGSHGCVEIPWPEPDTIGAHRVTTRTEEYWLWDEPAQEAMRLASALTGKRAVEARTLPYPAELRLNNLTGCPSFCRQPNACAGLGSCPRPLACSE